MAVCACAALVFLCGCRESGHDEGKRFMPEKKASPGPTIYQVKEKHEMDWMTIPGVTGVAIGERSRAPGLAIKVFVERISPALRQRIPAEVDSYPVEIEATGEFHAK